ncbi:MAG: DUF6599 family protein [bacterium]|nr:DUF6599 family protein [bacterium]
MVTTTVNRLLLLALLPAIAVALYYEGQRYDAALLQFNPSEYGTANETAFFPPQVEGYRRSGQLRRFTKETLYEYVNGHAEYFISAGFEGLTVGEYVREDGNPDAPDVAVDIYNMGNGIQAFGLFTDEAGDNQEEMSAGTMGFKTDQGLGFIKGPYYVKISRSDDRVPMERFAEAIDGNINATFDPFALFAQLPDLGEVAGTRYIKEAYRGLDFANHVIEREYQIRGNRVQIALFTQDRDEISPLVTAFRAFFDGSGTPYDAVQKGGVTLYRIQDPYEGDWILLPLATQLLGIFGTVDEALVEKLLPGQGVT